MGDYWGGERIVESDDSMISLTCRNHPTKRWATKNLGFIGARSIFYAGDLEHESIHGDAVCEVRQGMYGIAGLKSVRERKPEAAHLYPDEECECPASDLVPIDGPAFPRWDGPSAD